MATFHIHEDQRKLLPLKKVDKIITTKNSTLINRTKSSKNLVVETKKRLPLRTTNKYQPTRNEKTITTKPSNKVENKEYNIKEKKIAKLETSGEEELPVINEEIDKQNDPVQQPNRKDFYFNLDYITNNEYHQDILIYLLDLDRKTKRPKSDYIQKQPEITMKMRSVLVDWLSAVTEGYTLQPQTFQLAINYIDCFLNRMSVIKSKFQLVGTAAMMIAAKYEEIYPPETKEWVYVTANAYTPKQLLRMEQLMLKVLQFDLALPTFHTFISHICFVCKLSKKIMLLSLYLSELVLLEGVHYMKYSIPGLAFACIALARHTLNEPEIWPKYLQSITGYTLKDLFPIIRRQHKSYTDSPTRELQAIQNKYKSAKYERVSLYKPRKLEILI